MIYTSVQEYRKRLYYRGYRDDGTREQYIVYEARGRFKDPIPA